MLREPEGVCIGRAFGVSMMFSVLFKVSKDKRRKDLRILMLQRTNDVLDGTENTEQDGMMWLCEEYGEDVLSVGGGRGLSRRRKKKN